MGSKHRKSFAKVLLVRLKATRAVQWLMSAAIYLLIRLVYSLSKKEVRNEEIFEIFKKGAIIAMWHGRSLMLPPVARSYGIRGHIVSSMHADGLMMARALRMFGFSSIFGSSARGGVNVLRQGIRAIREKSIVCLTADGPKGPRMRLSPGCLYLAKMTGAPIVPVCITMTKRKILGSWDRMMVPMFFGKIICEIGKPVYFNRKNPNEMEDLRKKLEDFMVRQQNALDAEVGLRPIGQGAV